MNVISASYLTRFSQIQRDWSMISFHKVNTTTINFESYSNGSRKKETRRAEVSTNQIGVRLVILFLMMGHYVILVGCWLCMVCPKFFEFFEVGVVVVEKGAMNHFPCLRWWAIWLDAYLTRH